LEGQQRILKMHCRDIQQLQGESIPINDFAGIGATIERLRLVMQRLGTLVTAFERVVELQAERNKGPEESQGQGWDSKMKISPARAG
jgi:hypothetical protein